MFANVTAYSVFWLITLASCKSEFFPFTFTLQNVNKDVVSIGKSLVHDTTSSGNVTWYFDRAIQRPFSNSIFFPMKLKLWSCGFKM